MEKGYVPFGAASMAVGQSLVTDKGTWQIVGVMPPGISYSIDAAVDMGVHVHPHEVGIYATASVLLLAAGLAAAFGPARRASRVDPVIALRAD